MAQPGSITFNYARQAFSSGGNIDSAQYNLLTLGVAMMRNVGTTFNKFAQPDGINVYMPVSQLLNEFPGCTTSTNNYLSRYNNLNVWHGTAGSALTLPSPPTNNAVLTTVTPFYLSTFRDTRATTPGWSSAITLDSIAAAWTPNNSGQLAGLNLASFVSATAHEQPLTYAVVLTDSGTNNNPVNVQLTNTSTIATDIRIGLDNNKTATATVTNRWGNFAITTFTLFPAYGQWFIYVGGITTGHTISNNNYIYTGNTLTLTPVVLGGPNGTRHFMLSFTGPFFGSKTTGSVRINGVGDIIIVDKQYFQAGSTTTFKLYVLSDDASSGTQQASITFSIVCVANVSFLNISHFPTPSTPDIYYVGTSYTIDMHSSGGVDNTTNAVVAKIDTTQLTYSRNANILTVSPIAPGQITIVNLTVTGAADCAGTTSSFTYDYVIEMLPNPTDYRFMVTHYFGYGRALPVVPCGWGSQNQYDIGQQFFRGQADNIWHNNHLGGGLQNTGCVYSGYYNTNSAPVLVRMYAYCDDGFMLYVNRNYIATINIGWDHLATVDFYWQPGWNSITVQLYNFTGTYGFKAKFQINGYDVLVTSFETKLNDPTRPQWYTGDDQFLY